MSEQNQRRLRLLTRSAIAAAIVGLVVAAFLPPPSVAPASAQTVEPDPIDPAVLTAVQAVRRELALTGTDLASMGCTQAQAESVLIAVMDWCEFNLESLARSRADILLAECALREATRRYNVGPRDEGLIANLPRLRQAVGAAVAGRQQLLGGVIGSVEASLGGDQRSVWAVARSNAGRPSDLRCVPNVTDEQAERYETALRKRGRYGLSKAQVAERVLGVSQLSQADMARARIAQHLEGVLAAEAAVFPSPEFPIDLEPVDAVISP